MSNSDRPTAVFDGHVLVDPIAAAVATAVEREIIRRFLRDTPEIHARLEHFARRIVELGLSARDVVITNINVDEPLGEEIANVLMPGFDWAGIRASGQVPYARGLAQRGGIEELTLAIAPAVGQEMQGIDDVVVFAVDRGIVAVFPLRSVL